MQSDRAFPAVKGHRRSESVNGGERCAGYRAPASCNGKPWQKKHAVWLHHDGRGQQNASHTITPATNGKNGGRHEGCEEQVHLPEHELVSEEFRHCDNHHSDEEPRRPAPLLEQTETENDQRHKERDRRRKPGRLRSPERHGGQRRSRHRECGEVFELEVAVLAAIERFSGNGPRCGCPVHLEVAHGGRDAGGVQQRQRCDRDERQQSDGRPRPQGQTGVKRGSDSGLTPV